MRKDKEKVLDEVWTPERVRGFLDLRPQDGSNEDAYMLTLAYRSMRVDDFELFLQYFCEQGRDINARDTRGNTLLEILASHRHGAPYADALKSAGAV